MLNKIEKALRDQGFAGSTDIPKIVYLAATTRLLDKPVSLAVFGPSGVGKSYAVEAGLQFIPPNEIESLSGMSEKALPYLGAEKSLKNRVLFLGEAAGMADGNGRAFLRQLLTEGKIDYLTVQKTKDGLKGEKLPTVEGPISFMMTTTADRIHHEDQSRMLIFNLDYDRETIREVLRNSASGKSRSEFKLDLKPFHDLQDKIKSEMTYVEIPYSLNLSDLVPVENIKIQRDFPKVISLIRACALVHQDDRERDASGSILASREDYEIIYDLLATPLSQGLEADVTQGVKDVVEGLEYIKTSNPNDYYNGVSQSRLAEYLESDRSSVLRNVHSAIKHGYITNLNPGKGREAKLQIGERKISSDKVLPHPSVLFDGILPEQVHKCTPAEVKDIPVLTEDWIPQVSRVEVSEQIRW